MLFERLEIAVGFVKYDVVRRSQIVLVVPKCVDID